MGIDHVAVPGLDLTNITGQVDGNDWGADHLAPVWETPLILAVNAAVSPVAASAAGGTELYATGKSTRRVLDMRYVSEVRLTGLVITNSNAGNFKLSYMTTLAATWAGTDTGAIFSPTTGTAGALRVGAWAALPAGAQIADCALAVLVGTAIGTTAPALGSLTLQYR